MVKTKISEFTQDPNNANKGTDRGAEMVRQSLEKLGAGRSVLVDKNGVLIAGNKTAQAAIDAGLLDAIVVQTEGDRLVVVQRTDLDLATDARAKELAIADNRTAEVGLTWDPAALDGLAQEVDLSDWFDDGELEAIIDGLDTSTSRFTGNDDDDIPAISEGGTPLAIVLSSAELREWQVMKETAGTQSDKTAFLKLMRGEI